MLFDVGDLPVLTFGRPYSDYKWPLKLEFFLLFNVFSKPPNTTFYVF